MILDDLDVSALGDSDGIVWRLDGRGAVRVRADRMAGTSDHEWLERLAREAAEHWARHQHAHHDRYECAIRLRDLGWVGPISVWVVRPAAVVKRARVPLHFQYRCRDFDAEVAEAARLRSEG